MEFTKIHLIAAYSIIFVLVMAFTLVSGNDFILDGEPVGFTENNEFQKRVFCNAFSGCFGGKRSDEVTTKSQWRKMRKNWERERKERLRDQMLGGRQLPEEMLEYNR